jgi:hypothetical protein
MAIIEHKTRQGYAVDAWQPNGNLFDMSKWEIQKKMAMTERSNPDPDLPSNFRIDGNRKMYHSEESERIANMRIASNQGFREAIGRQPVNHIDIAPKERSNNYDYFNNSANYNKHWIKDTDIPLMLRIATREADPLSLTQNNTTEDPNLLADQQMAAYIAENLKANELATGKEFTASDLENIIRERFAGVNDNIVKLAVDLILNDAEDIKSRVAGTYNNFKLLVSARKPVFGKQQTQTTSSTTNQNQLPQQRQQSRSQTQQLQQKSASATANYKDMSWKQLRAIIIKSPQY